MMKKLFIFTAILLAAAVSFGKTSKTSNGASEDEKAAINLVLDKFDEAIKTQNASGLAPLLCEEAMLCGTDPSEFWNKQETIDMWTEALSQGPPPEFKYMGDREIVVGPGGKSAVAVTQYVIPAWSPNIPWRQVYHMVKVKKEWKILLINVAFIPKNEDIQKLNAALE
jgi:hypothetical protein